MSVIDLVYYLHINKTRTDHPVSQTHFSENSVWKKKSSPHIQLNITKLVSAPFLLDLSFLESEHGD